MKTRETPPSNRAARARVGGQPPTKKPIEPGVGIFSSTAPPSYVRDTLHYLISAYYSHKSIAALAQNTGLPPSAPRLGLSISLSNKLELLQPIAFTLTSVPVIPPRKQ